MIGSGEAGQNAVVTESKSKQCR